MSVRACPQCCSIYASDYEFCGLDGQRLVPVTHDPLIGKTIDRYTVIERLGDGAMGCVYRATHSVLPREYAVKVLYGEFASNKTLAARFQREAQAASRISHPNVVQVVDFGTSSTGLTFLVMEFLVGNTLEEQIRIQAPIEPQRVLEITKQIASGLGAAHELGYVHRDLKPANVLMAREQWGEQAKLVDFGIVGIMDDSEPAKLTQTGRLLGTPLYMAPEQLQDSRPSPSVDLYALGCIMYEMLSGRPPFDAEKLADLLMKHATEAPEALAPAQGVDRLCLRLLAKNPKDRPASAHDVIREIETLEAALSGKNFKASMVNELVTAVDLLGLQAALQESSPRGRLHEQHRATELITTPARTPSQVTPKPREQSTREQSTTAADVPFAPRGASSARRPANFDESHPGIEELVPKLRPPTNQAAISVGLLLLCGALAFVFLRDKIAALDWLGAGAPPAIATPSRLAASTSQRGLTTEDLSSHPGTRAAFEAWRAARDGKDPEKADRSLAALVQAVEGVRIDQPLLAQKLARTRRLAEQLPGEAGEKLRAELSSIEDALRTVKSDAEFEALARYLSSLEKSSRTAEVLRNGPENNGKPSRELTPTTRGSR